MAQGLKKRSNGGKSKKNKKARLNQSQRQHGRMFKNLPRLKSKTNLDSKLTRMINQKNQNIALDAALRSGEDLKTFKSQTNRQANTNQNISAKKKATIQANKSKDKGFKSRT